MLCAVAELFRGCMCFLSFPGPPTTYDPLCSALDWLDSASSSFLLLFVHAYTSGSGRIGLPSTARLATLSLCWININLLRTLCLHCFFSCFMVSTLKSQLDKNYGREEFNTHNRHTRRPGHTIPTRRRDRRRTVQTSTILHECVHILGVVMNLTSVDRDMVTLVVW